MEQDGTGSSDFWLETAASEVARVFFGHAYMIDSLGSLLPCQVDLTGVQRVLDVGCGNGEWARRMTREHPDIHIIGIDTSLKLIQEAAERASNESLGLLSFYQFGTAQSLNFPDESFDVVHVHSLASFISTAMWPRILDEMLRLLKTGGWLNIVDYEHGTTSSQAFNRLAALGMAGVRALGGSIAPASPTLGTAARLFGFLVDAGLVDVSYSVHAVDYGVSSQPGKKAFLYDMLVDIQQFKLFVVHLGLTNEQTFAELLEQTKVDFSLPAFCGYGYLISAVGRKEAW